MSTHFDSNNCGQSFHYFLRDEDGIVAVHADDKICESAEFNFADMDDLERVVECPWCLKKPANHDHIRGCSNWKPAPTREEVADAYSDPTEQAKRDRLLALMP